MSDRPDAESRAAIPVSRDEAKRWNTPDQGFGIFLTVNQFDGPRRKENLRRVIAWAVDMDEGSKEEQQARLLRSPLVPSMIVETKRGYQAWWIAKNGKPEHWNAIVLERLVPFFGSDRNARDLCRILRVPGFLHLKDPADPFLVKQVWRHDVGYTESQIGQAFAWVPNRAEHQRQLDDAKKSEERRAHELARQAAIAIGQVPTETLWEAIWNLDCEEGLRRLSGHWAVSGEAYTFKGAPRGHLNIYVDGKSSSCFVDANKHIGSLDGGGPTLVQWLRWFKHDWKTTISVLKEIFPQLVEVDEAAKKGRRS
jgi:hypothetical protein